MSFSLAQILEWTGGRLANAGVLPNQGEKIQVSRPAGLADACAENVCFFFNKEYQNELSTCAAGILITAEPFVAPLEVSGLPLWRSTAVVVCADPYLAMAILSEKLAPSLSTVAHVPGMRGATVTQIHPTAIVHATAVIGSGAQIGPYCVIEEGAQIGARTVLYPSCYVGPRASIGIDGVLFPQVTVYETVQIGDRTRLHSGVRLGSDGFGYAPRKDAVGKVNGHQKIYHLGRVIVGNDVEMGANTCVDRGTFADTVIGDRVKLDNQVHIGHNARLDEGAIVCGGTCLAGSASLGKYAYIGGLTGITNKVHVGDGASVGAVALVTKDVAAGATAVGNPQREYREHFKAHAALNRLVAAKKGSRK